MDEHEVPPAPKIFGTHDPKTLAQLRDVASRAERAALMADGHLGYVMPIGGVAAYRNKVSPVGVGFDIACGNAAIRTDVRADSYLAAEWDALADETSSTISFGIGQRNEGDDAPVDHPLFASDAWDLIPGRARDQLWTRARSQLGTVGGGNHYVDLLEDEEGFVWVGVHFGSRGLGHTIASGFLNLSQGRSWQHRGAKETEVLLDLSDPMGHDYWQLMSLAGEYAYAGREWVARKVVALLGGREEELVHNHHNFAWLEEHDGEKYVVIRKGATPAFPGQKGFIGGSMGDDAVIVQGAADDSEEQRAGMYSTVHGAGRVMSRTEAAGKRRWKTGEIIRPGRVSPEMMQDWITREGVILRGGGLDESPHAYRRLPEVLTAQGATIDILHRLRPIVVVMAPDRSHDPYRS